jgi:general secretion pathway protein D
VVAPVVALTAAGLTLSLRAQDGTAEAAAPPATAPTEAPAAQPAAAQGKPADAKPADAEPAAAPAEAGAAAVTAAADVKPAAGGATTQPVEDAPPKPAGKITLNFKDAPLDAVLEHLSSAAGLIVIKDGPVEGRVTVMSKQPVSAEEAVTLLSAVLKNLGFAAVQDGRVLTVVAREKAKKGNIPVHFGGDPDEIKSSNELITQVVPVRNIDALKLKSELQPLLSTEADVTATSGSNAIIVTDTSSNIRRLAQIIKSLDQGEASATEMRIIQLKHADAKAAAQLITTIYKPSGGAAGMSPQQIQMMQQQGMPVPPGAGGGNGKMPGGGGNVTAAADERTNTLVVTAPTDTLKVIDDIIERLDANPAASATDIRTFTLKYAEAEATAKLIKSIFKGDESSNDFNRYYGFRFGGGDDGALKVKVNADFDERTNSVIVTAPGPTLEVIAKLINDLDENPIATAELKVFQLKNAEAFSVSLLLEDVFKPKDDEEDSGLFRYIFYGGPEPAGGRRSVKMTAVSDDRTNSVIVTAPKEMLRAIEDVVTKLDSNPVSEEELFIYRLKNAEAANLEFVLNTLFGNITQPGQQGNGQFDPNQQQQQGQDFNGNGDRNRERNRDRGSNRGSGGGGRNGRQNRNMPQMTPGLQRAFTELTGEVFVVADVDTNALIVTTASKYEDQVRKLIGELDRPVPQVLIKVLVAEVTHTDDVDYGVDFSILNRRPSGLGQTYGTNFGNASATGGGLVVSVLEQDVNVTLRALQTAGKLDVLSRPYILASDNQLASILVGQEVPQIQNTRIVEEGDQINQYRYRDVGIILDVTPHINPDGQVILDVAPEISQLTDSSITVSPGVAIPILNKRNAESRVEVKNGQTIVIGGLMEDRKTSTVNKVPILGDIPLIGEVFRRTRRSKVKTELLIFLTPHVAEGPDTLEDMSADEMGGTKLTPDAVAPGMFQDHMRGMKRGAMPLTRAVGPDADSYVPTTRPAEPERGLEDGAAAPTTQPSDGGE